MQARWDLGEVLLSPHQDGHDVLNAEVPSPNLKIDAASLARTQTHLPKYAPMYPNLHPYPYVLKLGRLLVLLCTKTAIGDAEVSDLNSSYLFCV